MDAGSLRDRALAGVLIRKVVPAIVATLVAYAGLAHRDRRLVARALFCANRDQETERAKFLFGL